MRYCKKCVQPDTRPGIYFSEDGICGACLYQEEIKDIDWQARKKELFQIADWAKKTSAGVYNCAIGVSGGKDSTLQSIFARDVLGLRPLLVNSEPEGITEIGKHNIENLKNLGFDVIALRPNPLIMKKLVKRDFFRYLNPVKVTEYSLWASTYIIAQYFKIPLLIQGENPGMTLGVRKKTGMDGNALNADKQDTIEKNCFDEYASDGVANEDLFLFRYDREQLIREGVKGVWLSYYFKDWSQPGNAAFSISKGLRIKSEDIDLHSIGTYRRFFQLDSDLVQVNQMLKHIKLGFGQTTDHACYDIRGGCISREQGIALVKEYDGKCGDEYIKLFCDYISISVDEFWGTANKFRGNMWEKSTGGDWKLKDPIWERESVDAIDVNKVVNDLESSHKEEIAKAKDTITY